MSENSPAYGELLNTRKPIFVSCTSGTNAFTDVMLVAFRDGVRLNGHPEMIFNSDESVALARGILRVLGLPA